MANPLPSLQLRYHSKHSEPTVAAPSSLTDIIAPCLPKQKIGGLGLNLLEIVELGVNFVKDPMGAFSDVLLAFGGGLVGGLLDRLWDPLDELLKLGWETLKAAWPAFRDLMGMVRNMFENFLLSLYYRLTGQLQNPANAGRGDLRCECETPTTRGDLDRIAYESLPFGTEISKLIQSLISELTPEVWTYHDDIPTTSAEAFVERSILRRCARFNDRWGRLLDAYDVDDNVAQRASAHPTSPPYARAWKWSNSQLFVEVGFLRMYSFMVEGSKTSEFDAEHEGDGERMFMILDVIPTCDHLAKLRIYKIILSQHTTSTAYSWQELRMHNNRAIVCVGRGGHGLYIGGGPWEPGTKGYQNLSVELAPSPGESGAYGSATVKFATKLRADFDERAILYPDVQIYWGLYAVWPTNPSITWFWAIGELENSLDSSAAALKDHLSSPWRIFTPVTCQICGKEMLAERLLPVCGGGAVHRASVQTTNEKKPRQMNNEWIQQQDIQQVDGLVARNILHSDSCKVSS